MADDALFEQAARLLAPIEARLRHIEKELEPVRPMASEIARIGQELRDRDSRADRTDAAVSELQKAVQALRSQVDESKWIGRVAIALLLAGSVAWATRASAPTPVQVMVAPTSAPASAP